MADISIDMKGIMAEAEAKGKAMEALEARNKKRRAKGRKPLPDPQEKADEMVARKRYRTADPTTVNGEDALKLFEIRKAQMEIGGEDDDPEEDDAPAVRPVRAKPRDAATERAVREAEAARRVQDLKAGRIDHEGNWSEGGQKLEGGDSTKLVTAPEVAKAWGLENGSDNDSPAGLAKENPAGVARLDGAPDSFRSDLYRRLGTSFSAIERSLSDLQGRVAEILTAYAPQQQAQPSPSPEEEFKAMLERKTPVTFDVGGTVMSFDAVCVFSAPPCITVVSKIGSAKIMPKPGAQLLLSYEMDGKKYSKDPVTFLGTRFDLPMFGLSFVGFIRDADASMIDAAAGVSD